MKVLRLFFNGIWGIEKNLVCPSLHAFFGEYSSDFLDEQLSCADGHTEIVKKYVNGKCSTDCVTSKLQASL